MRHSPEGVFFSFPILSLVRDLNVCHRAGKIKKYGKEGENKDDVLHHNEYAFAGELGAEKFHSILYKQYEGLAPSFYSQLD